MGWRRSVFSTFFLGKLAMKQRLHPKLSTTVLKAALGDIVAGLQTLSRMAI